MHFFAFRWTTVVAVLFSIGLVARQSGYINYSVDDGLLSSAVYCVAQDATGWLWFGTQYGVSVFNRNRCENINRDHGLKNAEVFIIYPDIYYGALFFLTIRFYQVLNQLVFDKYGWSVLTCSINAPAYI